MRRLFQLLMHGVRRIFAVGGAGYLCDRCKWDYGDACSRPERPNAKTCPDYKRR